MPGDSASRKHAERSASGRAAPSGEASPDLASALFHQSPFSSVLYDPDGIVVDVNAAFTRLTGLTLEHVPPDYNVRSDPQLGEQGVLPLVERAFAGEAVTFPPVQWDARRYTDEGTVTWTQAHMYPVTDAAGDLLHVVLVHIDLTDRFEAEKGLRESRLAVTSAQQRLAAILDAVTDGITVQTAEGRIVYANNAAARLTGFATAEEFLASPMEEMRRRFDLLTSDGSEFPLEQLPARRAARGEAEPEQLVRYRIRATGEERWSFVRAREVPTPEGQTRLFVNYFHDVTEQLRRQRALEDTTARLQEIAAEQEATLQELTLRSREAEEARREAEWSEEQWRFLADASALLAGSLEVETTLRSVTRLAVPRIADWCALHVIDADGAVRQLEVAHVDPHRIEEARELQERYPPDPEMSGVHRVVKSGTSELIPVIDDALLVAAAQDAEHLERLRALGLRSAMVVPLIAHSRTVGALTLIAAESGRVYDDRDIAFAESLAERAASAIHAAELFEEAQNANRAKAEFLAVMSHELRTPLNAIMGYTDLLAGSVSGSINDAQRSQLGRIEQSARHLTELIDTVLAFARIEAGRDEVRHSVVDLNAVAAEATAFVQPQAEKKNIALSTHMPERPVIVQSDIAKVRQIMLNLLSNAVKFTEQGSITLEVLRDGADAVVRVSDTGIGIAPEDLPRIWEPFTQLEASLTRRAGGTGLGLPVSASLATLLGGSLDVTSSPGAGSTFSLRLPLQPAG